MNIRKDIEMVLNPNKNSRHISFSITLRELENQIDYKTLNVLPKVYELTIRGATRKDGCKCQMIDEIISYRDRVRKCDLPLFDFIIDIWRRYHLNGFQAGTQAQQEALAQAGMRNYATDYTKCCDYLESIDLYIDRGYRFGSGWLCEIIPTEIIERIKSL